MTPRLGGSGGGKMLKTQTNFMEDHVATIAVTCFEGRSRLDSSSGDHELQRDKRVAFSFIPFSLLAHLYSIVAGRRSGNTGLHIVRQKLHTDPCQPTLDLSFDVSQFEPCPTSCSFHSNPEDEKENKTTAHHSRARGIV